MRFMIVGLLGVACSGGSGAPPDATDGASPDSADGCGGCDAPPAPPDAATGCASLTYASRPVTSIELFEDAGRVHAARSFRVVIGYDATSCDRFAMPTWSVSTTNHVVGIEAHVFALSALCPGLPIPTTRVITLRLDAGAWRLIGLGAPVPPQLMLTVGPAPLVPCAPGPGECRQDCDCASDQRCLSGVGLAGPFLQCARPCELDRDCEGGQCTSTPDGLQLTCDASLDECGGPGQRCPDGFTCSAGTCGPDFVLSSSTRHECGCDADCAPGFRCVEPAIAGRTARCEIPCPTAGPWCQGAHFCGPAATDVSGLAPTDSLCGWAGD